MVFVCAQLPFSPRGVTVACTGGELTPLPPSVPLTAYDVFRLNQYKDVVQMVAGLCASVIRFVAAQSR
jgi:hypothetical protein